MDLDFFSPIWGKWVKQRATGQCYSMSSGRTGCGSGIIDFFSVSLDNAFLISV